MGNSFSYIIVGDGCRVYQLRNWSNQYRLSVIEMFNLNLIMVCCISLFVALIYEIEDNLCF